MLLNFTTILPFKWSSKYACCYCDETYSDYTKFRKHTMSHGPCPKKTLKRLKMYRKIMLDMSEVICVLCQTEFKSRESIVDHLIEIHSKEYDKNLGISCPEFRLIDLKCLTCDLQFESFCVFAGHVRTTHYRNRFECNECGKCFPTTAKIARHIKIHSASKVMSYSELIAMKKERLQQRVPRQPVELNYRCTECDAKYKLESSLNKHIEKEHSDDGSLKCENCSKKMPSAMALIVHSTRCKQKIVKKSNADYFLLPDKITNRNAHCNQIRRNIQCVLNMSTAVPFKFKGKFTCFYCSQWFPDFDDLIVHTKQNHPVCDLQSKAMKTCKGEKTRIKLDVNGLACKECQQPMADLPTFVDHIVTEHKADYDTSVPLRVCFEAFYITQGNIPCPECQEQFTYFATLLKHLGAEHNDHKAICAYCGRGFRTTTSLAMHISNSHTGACTCNVCNTDCNNASALARHMARYHDAKDFKCAQCPEVFQTMYKKQNHLIKAHNVGHKCAYCEKMFTRNSFMVNHVRRTHLKERTVPCSVCNLKFFDIYHMKLHMVKHDGMRKFNCDVCGKSFLRAKNLKSHMDTHKKGLLQEVIQ